MEEIAGLVANIVADAIAAFLALGLIVPAAICLGLVTLAGFYALGAPGGFYAGLSLAGFGAVAGLGLGLQLNRLFRPWSLVRIVLHIAFAAGIVLAAAKSSLS